MFGICSHRINLVLTNITVIFVKPDIGEAHWSGQSYKRLIVAAGIREAGKSS